MHAVVGHLQVDFDLVDDGNGVEEVLCSISTGAFDLVAFTLEEVPGLIVALQRVVDEAKRRGVEVGSPLPLVVHVD